METLISIIAGGIGVGLFIFTVVIGCGIVHGFKVGSTKRK